MHLGRNHNKRLSETQILEAPLPKASLLVLAPRFLHRNLSPNRVRLQSQEACSVRRATLDLVSQVKQLLLAQHPIWIMDLDLEQTKAKEVSGSRLNQIEPIFLNKIINHKRHRVKDSARNLAKNLVTLTATSSQVLLVPRAIALDSNQATASDNNLDQIYSTKLSIKNPRKCTRLKTTRKIKMYPTQWPKPVKLPTRKLSTVLTPWLWSANSPMQNATCRWWAPQARSSWFKVNEDQWTITPTCKSWQ